MLLCGGRSRDRHHDGKVMTDLHGLPLWLSMSRRVMVALKSYFGSNPLTSVSLRDLPVGDYWRFLKDCFQQKLILYKAPLL